jgi:protein-L-isoaspartate O-methyltransferase
VTPPNTELGLSEAIGSASAAGLFLNAYEVGTIVIAAAAAVVPRNLLRDIPPPGLSVFFINYQVKVFIEFKIK